MQINNLWKGYTTLKRNIRLRQYDFKALNQGNWKRNYDMSMI